MQASHSRLVLPVAETAERRQQPPAVVVVAAERSNADYLAGKQQLFHDLEQQNLHSILPSNLLAAAIRTEQEAEPDKLDLLLSGCKQKVKKHLQQSRQLLLTTVGCKDYVKHRQTCHASM